MGFLSYDTQLIVLEALGLLVGDRFLSPYLSSSEFGFLLLIGLQAWIFLQIRSKHTRQLPAVGGTGVGPVVGIY